MNLKKILLTAALALVLVWLFLPDTDSTLPAALTPAAAPADTLTLVTPSPSHSPLPTMAPTPVVQETPKPLATRAPAARETPKPLGTDSRSDEDSAPLDEYGSYTTKDDLALYIHTYGHLPDNFIRKKEAEALGWSGGPLDRVLPGMCIGGDYFGNYEGLLPKAKGRRWTECDVNTLGKKSRGSERIIFSNDGLIYYTADHYESFEQLY